MYNPFLKKLIDLIGLIIISIPLLFLGIVIGFLIKADSKGKVFFKQARLGKSGKIFYIYKFRTMVANAEKTGTGVFTNDADPRITKVGHLLRKTSLDELPQVINILKGEMTFVGPRPPVPYHPYKYEEYNNSQKKRFFVKPGITGLAQVSGRNNLSWDERIKFDVEYVQRCSVTLDIKILIKTLLKVFKSDDIYKKGA